MIEYMHGGAKSYDRIVNKLLLFVVVSFTLIFFSGCFKRIVVSSCEQERKIVSNLYVGKINVENVDLSSILVMAKCLELDEQLKLSGWIRANVDADILRQVVDHIKKLGEESLLIELLEFNLATDESEFFKRARDIVDKFVSLESGKVEAGKNNSMEGVVEYLFFALKRKNLKKSLEWLEGLRDVIPAFEYAYLRGMGLYSLDTDQAIQMLRFAAQAGKISAAVVASRLLYSKKRYAEAFYILKKIENLLGVDEIKFEVELAKRAGFDDEVKRLRKKFAVILREWLR